MVQMTAIGMDVIVLGIVVGVGTSTLMWRRACQ
jgi:hypothetical protein